MNFLEKDLEDIIFNSSVEELSSRGLYVPKKRIRQLRIGNYGRCDIAAISRPLYLTDYGHDGKLDVYLYELKKDKINQESIIQCLRYMKGVDSYIRQSKYRCNYFINGYVIGREIDVNTDLLYLPSLVCSDLFDLSFYSYEYNIDGIKFERRDNYKLTEEGFEINPFSDKIFS